MATRWGIVSAGRISHDFVSSVRTLSKEEHKIVAVAARDLKKAEQFAARHHIPKAYGSYEELAEDKDVEIAYVGVLNRQHLEVGKLLLDSGKPVLMEKPMGMNLKQTRELIQLAKRKNVFLMEGVWSRFFPAYAQLAKELEAKTIGDVLYAHVAHGFAGEQAARIQKKDLGGSITLDIGVYVANALSFVYREKPEKILAVGKKNEEGVDQNVAMSLLYSGGRIANGALSSLAVLPNELVITGTKGDIKIPNPYHCPTELITPGKTYSFPLPDTALPCNYVNSSGLRYEAMRVRECLKQGLKECPEMTHQDSELLAEIMDELRRQVGVVYPEDSA